MRACFIQDQLRQKQLFVFGVRGEANVADLFTKPLSLTVTLKHMWGLGLRDVVCAACVLDGFVELCGVLLVGRNPVSLTDRYKALSFAPWLVIEFCAPVESSLRAASENLQWVNVLTVSERDDGASQQTMLELKAICALQIRRKRLRLPVGQHPLHRWLSIPALARPRPRLPTWSFGSALETSPKVVEDCCRVNWFCACLGG